MKSTTWYSAPLEQKFLSSLGSEDRAIRPFISKLFATLIKHDALLFTEILSIKIGSRFGQLAFKAPFLPMQKTNWETALARMQVLLLVCDRLTWAVCCLLRNDITKPQQQPFVAYPVLLDEAMSLYNAVLNWNQTVKVFMAQMRSSDQQERCRLDTQTTGVITTVASADPTLDLLMAYSSILNSQHGTNVQMNFIMAALAIRALLVVRNTLKYFRNMY